MKECCQDFGRRGFLFVSLCFGVPFLAGCQNDIRSGGPDIKYLEVQAKSSLVGEADNPLLPLNKGAYWDMTAYYQDPNRNVPVITKDRYVVTGPITVGGITATEIQLQRNGGKWRRELYRVNGNVLELVGSQDENAELMQYAPPIPLLMYPAKEGNYQKWLGQFSMKGQMLPGQALSRITSTDYIKTPAGIFKTLRIDTMISINQGDRVISFPSVRWLAPGIGFVRRSYAEKGHPATAEVTHFQP
jgi:hypothetical protein